MATAHLSDIARAVLQSHRETYPDGLLQVTGMTLTEVGFERKVYTVKGVWFGRRSMFSRQWLATVTPQGIDVRESLTIL